MSKAIVEITEEVYRRAMSGKDSSAENAKYWFAAVNYLDLSGPKEKVIVKYFKFDEPYNVKVSDFFHWEDNKDITVQSMVMS